MINVFLQLSIKSFIQLLVVLLVIATSDVVHPLLVVEIPTDCQLYSFFELKLDLRPSVGRGVLPPLSSAGCYQHPINASFAQPSSLWRLSAYYRFAYIFS